MKGHLLARFSAILFAAALLTLAAPLSADDVAVPISLQVDLLVKVAGYDKNLPPRAGDRVRVLLVTKQASVESLRAAAQADKALGHKETIAGMPHERSTVSYTDPTALARLTRSRRISIVYVMPGFSEAEIHGIARAFEGGDVLSASAVASFVPQGIVLGFDLVSGKPKLLVHLRQARRQRVDLSADVLKLMKVVE